MYDGVQYHHTTLEYEEGFETWSELHVSIVVMKDINLAKLLHTQLPKPGPDPTQKVCYRNIAMQNICGKLLETITRKVMLQFEIRANTSHVYGKI